MNVSKGLLHNSFTLLFLLIFLGCSSQQGDYGQLNFMTKLPAKLDENSGIVYLRGSENIWIIEDNGNKDHLYAVNFQGQISKNFKVDNAENHDWEDLTTDRKGNLYIGDFGNNNNERKNLTIYKLPNPELEKGDKIASEKITFRYPEQKDFPPKKSGLLYDSEGFFHWNGYLYIFTKDRSRPYLGKTLVYRIPDKKGDYKAQLVGTLNLCNNQDHCSVTSADISEDGKTIALIGYGYLFLGKGIDLNAISKTKFESIDLKCDTQIESVCFLNDSTLLITDEQSHDKGRNLYSYSLKE